MPPVPAVPTRPAPAPAKAAARPSGTVAPRPATLATRQTGPQLFQTLRVALILITLAATVLSVIAIKASESNQVITAATAANAQDLRDLRVAVTHAQAAATVTLITPNAPASAWKTYDDMTGTADAAFLAAASSSRNPADLIPVASALRSWYNAVAVARAAGLNLTTTGDLTNSFTTLRDALDKAIPQAPTWSGSSSLLVIAIVAASLAILAYAGAGVLLARRTHRVINLGLAVGLVAAIAALVIVANYASQVRQVSVADSETATLSELESDVWESQAWAATSVLDPTWWGYYTEQASTLAASLPDRVPLTVTTPAFVDQVVTRTADIAAAPDPEVRRPLVVDGAPWETLARDIRQGYRPVTNAVVPALWYDIGLAGCGVVAITATLAGIYTRSKEYL